MWKRIFILGFVFIGLVGCGTQNNISATSTSVNLLTQTPSLTLTSFPTFSNIDIKINALNLLKNNGNCKLPCIWGLTPGVTTTFQRQNILEAYCEFSEDNFYISGSDSSENPGGFGIGFIESGLKISIGLSYYETNNLIEILTLVADPQQDQKYVFGDSTYLNLIEYYTLPKLLSNYGVPSDVLVHALPYGVFSKADYEPFSLVVIYSGLGIMAEYISPTQWIGDMVELPTPGLLVGEIARGCPSQSYITLRTWDVKKNISIKEIASIAAGEGISGTAYDYFFPIQEATTISINDFYESFKNPNNNQCLNIPSSLFLE